MRTAAVLVIMIAAVVLLARWWLITHPRTSCRWCRGSGKNRFSTRWREGICKHCGGTGKRRGWLGGE